MIIGEPTVAANSEVSAETFSETCAAAVVTVSMFSSWVFDEATRVAVSSSTGTVWSVSSLTDAVASSSTRRA